MVRSLPLRSGFFAAPQITPSEETEFLAWGRSLVSYLHESPAEWTVVREKKGIQLCEDRQKGGLMYSVKSVATIRASLDNIMDMFMTNTTVDFRSLMRFQLRDYFCDSAVLYQKDQNESESLSIKWFAVRNKKSSINPMVQNQDFCVMEYTGVLSADVISGDSKKLVGVCLYESIEQSECPSLWESHKLERGSISKCGYLFRPREEGLVEVQFVCSIRQPPNGRSKRRLNRNVLVSWAESVGFIEESISRRRISREMIFRKNLTWVSDSERQCCHLCLKTFTHTRRKHHCRACGEIICRSCSLYKSMDLQSVGLITLRVCKSCMDGSRAEQQQTASMTSSGLERPRLAKDVDEQSLREAVEEYALALPSQNISSVPDLVGVAWLKQVVARDPSKRELVESLMGHLRINVDDGSSPATEEEQVDIYDTLCDLAAQTLSCKYAVVSLIDENRQWFKSAINVKKTDVPRDFSFCEYPVSQQKPLVVMDTLKDNRFVNNPFVTGPLGVRFLAGAPLFTVENVCVGAVCVLDTEPRQHLEEHQIATMQNLAHLAMVMVQERRVAQSKAMSLVPNTPLLLNQAFSSDLVPLHSYTGELGIEVKSTTTPTTEDPVLKQQMIKLLQKASEVRDQVNKQAMNVQQAGLQSAAE
jgi:hypothetical protein